MNKAAIVIGVNNTGQLPVLNAAVSGAEKVGQWLSREGFKVYRFVDTRRPVTANAICKKIRTLVDQGTLEQLVIYFSGHGFQLNFTEYWMLSGAPDNANEAICLLENIELARACGIPNVVLISDACRSTPDSLAAGRVRGSLIFPNEAVSQSVSPEIDRFFATLVGRAAVEMIVKESVKQYEGIFTHCFLQAYRTPDANMIRAVRVGQKAINVVPNRLLKEYLRREVPAHLLQKSLKVGQLPDAIIESGDDFYLAPVRPESLSFPTGEPTPRQIIDVQDVAEVALTQAMGAAALAPKSIIEAIDARGVDQTDFAASVEQVDQAQQQGRGHYETRTGLTVVGAQVAEAYALQMGVVMLNPGDSLNPAHVRLIPPAAGGLGYPGVSSVILRFAGGTGTVVAGLENYIGTILVENGRVVNVSYAPSDNSHLWNDYQYERDRLEKLRALVAAAASHGVFRVGRENAQSMANAIRYLKSIDPTLGLYAAYAYADIGMREEVKSVLEYMEADLAARLFDVAMLANEPAEAHLSQPHRVVPFCPLLAQGWSLLRVKQAKIPAAAERASEYLLPALWTTFAPAGMDNIVSIIQERGIL
jgi:hypothetical protein